jgi:hypothetical protein
MRNITTDKHKLTEVMNPSASSSPSIPFHWHNGSCLLRLGLSVILSIIVLLGLYHTSVLWYVPLTLQSRSRD